VPEKQQEQRCTSAENSTADWFFEDVDVKKNGTTEQSNDRYNGQETLGNIFFFHVLFENFFL
jgi:hypothetical protein